MSGPSFAGRIKKLRNLIEKNRLDACLVNSTNDIYYYTGAEVGDFSFLVIPKNPKPCMFVTSLDNEVVETKNFDVRSFKRLSEVAKELNGFKRVGFDEYSVNCSVFSKLKKSKAQLKQAASIIKQPRMVKDNWEMEQIAKSAAIVRKTMSVLENVSGKTESDIADKIDFSLRKAGARNSFDTIVASGKHSAFVHHKPDRLKIENNDMVIVDMGARLNKYCSDMTRTFCKKPGPREKKIIENISQIQKELIDMAREGVKYDEIEKRYEALLKRNGYRVMHSFGHGVGINVHERPAKGDVLKSGMVITVEPGAYIKNFGGCRIEDMVIVRKGNPRIITRIPD